MTILQVFDDIHGLPTPNQLRVVQTAVSPPDALITMVGVLAFADDRLLMTHLTSRGWDIPGGHREPGETPAETLQREVYEETCAYLADWQIFAHIHVHVAAPKPNGYKYPHPDSYILLYLAQVARLDPFVATAEAVDRQLFSPSEARQQSWIQRNQPLYEAARIFNAAG